VFQGFGERAILLGEKYGRGLVCIICIAVLCVILVAGLWPFHAPNNAVSCVGEGNGLRFAYPGTIVGAGQFPPASPGESSCSIEAWLQPAHAHDSNTLLAFYTPENPLQLTLRQSDADLLLARDLGRGRHQTRTAALYVDDVFRSRKSLFITVSSGPRGTTVYIDGVPARTAPNFRVSAEDCAGRLIVATSPVTNGAWTGTLFGLAIYRSEITPTQAVRHYETWTRTGHPETITEDERCAALYLFDEHSGNRVHNRLGPGSDLLIPRNYQLQDATVLAPFWKEFNFSRGYWSDVLVNIGGFIPLGFFFCAYLSWRGSSRRLVWVTVATGALVSITIEVLQVYLPTRDSDTTDILTNTLGTWAGVMLYRVLAMRREWVFHTLERIGGRSLR
jgi:VanZ like family/Concanavalin A-like lectin/glucanases superfamily